MLNTDIYGDIKNSSLDIQKGISYEDFMFLL